MINNLNIFPHFVDIDALNNILLMIIEMGVIFGAITLIIIH